jgi:hypothetical protein
VLNRVIQKENEQLKAQNQKFQKGIEKLHYENMDLHERLIRSSQPSHRTRAIGRLNILINAAGFLSHGWDDSSFGQF